MIIFLRKGRHIRVGIAISVGSNNLQLLYNHGCAESACTGTKCCLTARHNDRVNGAVCASMCSEADAISREPVHLLPAGSDSCAHI